MAITINNTEDSYKDSKLVYFTIGYNGVDYKWHGNMPSDANAQEYWDSKEDELKCNLLRVQYRRAVVPFAGDKTSLESFETWVSGGCTNAEVTGKDSDGNDVVIKAAEVITKKTWVDSH